MESELKLHIMCNRKTYERLCQRNFDTLKTLWQHNCFCVYVSGKVISCQSVLGSESGSICKHRLL